MTINEEPIFIVGNHRSGTSLLRNLFDSHPDLAVFPFEYHFFKFAGYWVDYYPFKRKLNDYTTTQIIHSLLESYEIANRDKAKDSQGERTLAYDIDLDAALDYFDKAINESDSNKDIFEETIRFSYCQATKKAMGNKRLVEKSVENQEFVRELMDWFPKAKFIHVIRNPYDNFVSYRRYLQNYNNGKYPYLKSVFLALKHGYYWALKNKSLGNYYNLNYEDLVKNPLNTMLGLCDFLNLEYDKILLRPTNAGQYWEGNSVSGEKFNGVSTNRLNKWRSEIKPLEIHLVNKFFSEVLFEFGYDQIPTPKRKYWIPYKKERPNKYIFNRLLKYFMH